MDMRKKKIMVLLFCFLLCVIGLTSCLSREQEEKLEGQQQEAADYYEEKYGVSGIRVEKSGYLSSDGLFGLEAGDNMYFVMDDGNTVVYFSKEERFGDNRQKEEIMAAIEKYMWNPALEKLKEDAGAEDIVCQEIVFNKCKADNFDDVIFTAYYNGDADAFIEEEQLRISGGSIYILCRESDSYRTAVSDFGAWIQEHFTQAGLNVLAVAEECAEDYVNAGSNTLRFYEDGCYLQCMISNTEVEIYEANYIPLMQGIYVTSAEPDFMLEEGDVFLGESFTEDEIQKIIDENYDRLPETASENKDGVYTKRDKKHVSKAVIYTDTPVYRVVFSERVRNITDDKGNFTCYFKFVPEEVPDRGSSLLYFPYGKPDVYSCFQICSQDRIFAMNSLNEMDYYFLGEQNR